ncbi:MAG: glycosyltransferase, partial [Pseudomonadota bacterium]
MARWARRCLLAAARQDRYRFAMLTVALIAFVIWAAMLLVWHGFWRADQRLPPSTPDDASDRPGVVAVIPARNEAASIGAVVEAHGASRYTGSFAVVLVDDNSDDGTAEIADAAKAAAGHPLHVIPGAPLAAGWSGKLWALEQGIAAAERLYPEARYLLLTDADIIHAPDTLDRLVRMAESRELALTSLMARLAVGEGRWRLGRVLVPAYVFFFQKLYPFPAVNDPSSRIAGAAGGCMLVRRDALAAIGGIGSIRGALIDDCTLAAAIKGMPQGGERRSIWLGLSNGEVTSLRDTGAMATIWETVARTAFPQLQRSWWLLAGSTLGMALLYLAPPAAAIWGILAGDTATALAGLAGWGLMARAFWPTLSLYGGRIWEALTLPLVAVLYMLMTLDSARRDLLGKA